MSKARFIQLTAAAPCGRSTNTSGRPPTGRTWMRSAETSVSPGHDDHLDVVLLEVPRRAPEFRGIGEGTLGEDQCVDLLVIDGRQQRVGVPDDGHTGRRLVGSEGGGVSAPTIVYPSQRSRLRTCATWSMWIGVPTISTRVSRWPRATGVLHRAPEHEAGQHKRRAAHREHDDEVTAGQLVLGQEAAMPTQPPRVTAAAATTRLYSSVPTPSTRRP